MKIKTSELKDAALDWAVDQALGATMSTEDWLYRYKFLEGERYSSDWKHGGPIIDRMKPLTGVIDPNTEDEEWYCTIPPDTNEQTGPTLLIAAMRCYVASELGAEVDVPEELV